MRSISSGRMATWRSRILAGPRWRWPTIWTRASSRRRFEVAEGRGDLARRLFRARALIVLRRRPSVLDEFPLRPHLRVRRGVRGRGWINPRPSHFVATAFAAPHVLGFAFRRLLRIHLGLAIRTESVGAGLRACL